MNKIFLRLTAGCLGLLVALTGFGQVNPAPANAPKIILLPTRVYTRVVIEAASPLAGVTAAYAPGPAATLVVDLGRTAAPAAPLVPADDPQLVKEVKVQAHPDGRVSLHLGLLEAVPYRLWAEGSKILLELNKIIRGNEYFLSPEAQADLNRTPRKPFSLATVETADRNDGLEVTAKLGQKGLVNVFALENPLRLVIDVIDALLLGPVPTRTIDKYGVERVKVAQFRTGAPYAVTRIVFDLKESRAYALGNTASGLTISLPGDTAAAATVLPKTEPPAPKTETPPSKPETKAVADKPAAATVLPKTEPPAPKTETPPSKPVTKVVEDKPEAATVQPKTDTPPAVPTKAEELKKDEQKVENKYQPRTLHDQSRKYAGELLSPKFKDADLRDVVLWLCQQVGLNVIFDPEVKGTVTCSFEDVPWDQFLDYILKNNKMGQILDGNILRIAPIGVLAEEQRQEQSLRDAVEQSGPLVTKTYTLSYAKAQEVLDLMKDQKSPRGQMVIDARTNTLIVRDTQEKIDLLDTLVLDLDTQTPQVQIETRIVEATSNFVRNLGIQWGTQGVVDPFYGNQTSLQFPNKILVDGAQIPQGATTRGIGGPLGGYAINLPASGFNTVFGLSFANILDTFRLDMAVSAMESRGQGRIVSSQRITAQNNKEAYINQGRQIPVQTQANFTVTVQYVNAGLELRATPQITAEGTIIMYVEIQNNAADFANLVNGIPPITTQSARTTVTVPDGGTTVIGGIYRVEDSVTRERVPFLHQIPLLGNLFRNSAVTKQNRELLIFITPRILR